MFGSTILEVAIGLVLVYLLLSLTASAINEGIARLLALRASTLQAGIQTLLDDPKSKEVMNAFYNHPLLQSLARDGYFDQLIRRESKPSYIPADYFRLILLDLPRLGLFNNSTPTFGTSGSTVSTTTQLPTKIGTVDELKSLITTLPKGKLQDNLLLVVNDAGDDLVQAQAAIEKWFDNSMEHVTGWYKRKVELIILVIGIVLSIVLNIDTIDIANTLANDSTLRAATVALADETVAQGLAETSDPSTAVTNLTSKIEELGLPIGWKEEVWRNLEGKKLCNEAEQQDPATQAQCIKPTDEVKVLWFTDWQVNWWTKIPGLWLSGIAVSLGAPFWFDLLSKIVNVRATGKKQEESKTNEEKPKTEKDEAPNN